ncbi:hypothetical protein BDW62DRAFT_173319 [Aspergillus aurantiobrunneus]
MGLGRRQQIESKPTNRGRAMSSQTIIGGGLGFHALGMEADYAFAGEGSSDGNLNLSVSNVSINYYAGAKAESTNEPGQTGKGSRVGKQRKDAIPKNIAARSARPKRCDAPKPVIRQKYPIEILQTYVPPPAKPTLSLDLLNGSYKIDAQETNTRNSGMVLCLEKSSIWGEFQLGDVEGVFSMRERPWGVSFSNHGGCVFEWRGVDQANNSTYAGPDCWGEMRFLSEGNVEGTFYNVISDEDEERFN